MVQRGGDWAGRSPLRSFLAVLNVTGWAVTFNTTRRDLSELRPAQSPPRCTKCPLINGKYTKNYQSPYYCINSVALRF